MRMLQITTIEMGETYEMWINPQKITAVRINQYNLTTLLDIGKDTYQVDESASSLVDRIDHALAA